MGAEHSGALAKLWTGFLQCTGLQRWGAERTAATGLGAGEEVWPSPGHWPSICSGAGAQELTTDSGPRAWDVNQGDPRAA